MMKENEFDVIVVGAGPGGSTTASFLSKNGARVLLLDKASFPRDKTCGDAIGRRCETIMKELGIPKEVEKIPHAKIFGVTFSAPNGKIAEIAVPKGRNSDYSYCARREVFDNIVFQFAKKQENVHAIENFMVTDVLKEKKGEKDFVVGVKGTYLKSKHETEFRAKVVVGADGALSVVARKLGLNEVDLPHHCVAVRAYYDGVEGLTDKIEIHFVESSMPGYFWIFPIEEGKANVGIGMLSNEITERGIKLQETMFKVIQNEPMFKARFKNAKLVSDVKGWTLPLGSKERKSYGDGFVLVGDAASLIDPFSGEGVGNAMIAGKIAATTIAKALQLNDFSENTLKAYHQQLWKELGPELKTSYRLQRLGKNKLLLNWVVGKASRSKKVAETLSGMLVDEVPKQQLANPLFYLKLLMS
jgi:geranylgeranyl reductase family protein